MRFIVTKYSFFVIVFGFLTTIFLGIICFYYLPVTKESLSFIDSFLLSTSLITGVGISSCSFLDFTSLGKIVSIILMYIGSVGIITILLGILLYFSIYSVEWYGIAREIMDIININNIHTFLKIIFTISFISQLLGTLFFISLGNFIKNPLTIIDALFISVNFFCNVGFPLNSLFEKTLYSSSLFYIISSIIIILGSSSFFIFFELQRYIFSKKTKKEYTPSLTFYLLAIMYFGSILIFWLFYIFSCENTLSLFSLSRSFFASVSLRSCGISPYHSLSSPLIFISSLYGILGTCPCGTGGGIKSSMVGILSFTSFTLLKKEQCVNILNKTISWFLVACSHIFIFYIIFFTLFISFIIDFYSMHTVDFFLIFSDILGLITGSGTPWTELIFRIGGGGKIIFILLMIIGKISTISFSLYISKIKKENIQYPKAKLIII